MDCILPGSCVHGILQAGILDGLPYPSPGDLFDPGSNSHLLHLLHWQAGSLPLASPGKTHHSVQFSPVGQSCLSLCNLMKRSTPGLPIHHQLLESTQTHCVDDAIQPSYPLSSPSPLFQFVASLVFRHLGATGIRQDDRSSSQWILTNKLVQRCFS